MGGRWPWGGSTAATPRARNRTSLACPWMAAIIATCLLTTTDHLLAASFVAWSKDGRSILFNQQQQAGTDHWGVMRVPAEGGGPATLVIAAPSMLSFDVSPDGSRIAYSTSERPDELWALDNVLSALK